MQVGSSMKVQGQGGSRPVAVPRPSASLIVVNAANEVLLVHRNPEATAFGGVHVFPGGNFDPAQDASYQMTAIRETFEETGLLLTSSAGALDDPTLDTARAAVHAQKLRFGDFLATHQLTADTDALLPFTEWVTPPGLPRRFHARFYLAFLPARGFGAKAQRLPTPDGGLEVVAARFVHPARALAEFRARRILLMPPQYYLLSTLADLLGDPGAAGERARVQALARGAFGRMVMNPRAHPGGRDPDGRSILTYEGDEARGGPPGRLHRSLVRTAERGACSEIVLLRNFDIFTEIPERAEEGKAKL